MKGDSPPGETPSLASPIDSPPVETPSLASPIDSPPGETPSLASPIYDENTSLQRTVASLTAHVAVLSAQMQGHSSRDTSRSSSRSRRSGRPRPGKKARAKRRAQAASQQPQSEDNHEEQEDQEDPSQPSELPADTAVTVDTNMCLSHADASEDVEGNEVGVQSTLESAPVQRRDRSHSRTRINPTADVQVYDADDPDASVSCDQEDSLTEDDREALARLLAKAQGSREIAALLYTSAREPAKRFGVASRSVSASSRGSLHAEETPGSGSGDVTAAHSHVPSTLIQLPMTQHQSGPASQSSCAANPCGYQPLAMPAEDPCAACDSGGGPAAQGLSTAASPACATVSAVEEARSRSSLASATVSGNPAQAAVSTEVQPTHQSQPVGPKGKGNPTRSGSAAQAKPMPKGSKGQQRCDTKGQPRGDGKGMFAPASIPRSNPEFGSFVNTNVPNQDCGNIPNQNAHPNGGDGAGATNHTSPSAGNVSSGSGNQIPVADATAGASGINPHQDPTGSAGLSRQNPFAGLAIPCTSNEFATFVAGNVPNRGCGETGTDGAAPRQNRRELGASTASGRIRTVNREETRLQSGSEPGWSGPGERGLIRTRILPEVLRSCLPCSGRVTMSFGGSYVRHTAFCYADIDIEIQTDVPVTESQRAAILDRLQAHKQLYAQERRHFGSARFSLQPSTIKVTIPKIKQDIEYGSDEYDIVFLCRTPTWRGEQLQYASLRQSDDRIEADALLLDFFRGNDGAQHVARMIKYATYNVTSRMSGVLIDSFVKRVAETQGYGDSPRGIKVECTERQHDLYRAAVEQFRIGSSSNILKLLLQDVQLHDRNDCDMLAATQDMVKAMSSFYSTDWNREHVQVKRNPARPWTAWNYLGPRTIEILPRPPCTAERCMPSRRGRSSSPATRLA